MELFIGNVVMKIQDHDLLRLINWLSGNFFQVSNGKLSATIQGLGKIWQGSK